MNTPKEFAHDQESQPSIDINRILHIVLRRWFVIVGALLVSLFVAFIILRYTKPKYRASIKLKLDDEKPNQISDLFRFGRTTGKFDNFLKTESEVIRSKAYAEKALAKLGLDYIYYLKGNFVTTQLYPNSYFKITTLYADSAFNGSTFILEYASQSTYRIKQGGKKDEGILHRIGDTLSINGSSIVVDYPEGKTRLSYFPSVTCVKATHKSLAPSFASGIQVDVVKGTSLITLEFTNEVPQLARDYLNTFANFYVKENVNNKSLAAEQTLNFIDNQLINLAAKVQKSEVDLTDLKSQNNGVEIDALGNAQAQKLASMEVERNLLLINLDVMQKLQSSLSENKDEAINFVIFDKEDAASIPQLLESYNELVLERISLLQKNTPASPLALENETKIRETRNILRKTIKGVIDKINTKIAFVDKRTADVHEVLNSIPMRQRMLINIQRDFKVNEKVYTYLFEKKLETSINKSSITSNITIVEAAESPTSPVSPNTKQAYLMAVVIGLAASLGYIVITRIIYQKIPDKETIERLSSVPVLGVIQKIDNDDNEYEVHAFRNPKSVFSESIRGIRTGISFIAKGSDHKVICVTSTVSGEGKTFCSINLAASFTLLNKKVILIGCDLRRPKIHLSFQHITNSKGLTTYLIGKSTLEDIIQHTEHPNFDLITAGPTPPNPSELLQMEEMTQLLQTLRQRYDYIIIDSAPVGLVSDSLSIMEQSDINLFVLRSNYSKRDFAMIPDRLQMDSKIKNMYILLNAYDPSAIVYSSIYKNEYGGHYGGGGYYYGGYYGKGGYGYYGKKYSNTYYSGYYSEDERKQFSLDRFMRMLPFKKKK